MIWWILIIVAVVLVVFIAICVWLSYKIAKCLDRFEEFNFDDEL